MNAEEKTKVASQDSLADAPWFLLAYFAALLLFLEVDWKLGTGWFLWRAANNMRGSWGNKPEDSKERR